MGVRISGRRAISGLMLIVVFMISIGLVGVAGPSYPSVSAAGLAEPADISGIMPLSDIQPGMKGIGKTVIQGTRVDDFEVEVLAVLKGDVPDSDMVLVRLGGELIKKTGGLAAGMSGSPVYISGRLAGALSYGYEFADHNVALMTPAERMMKLFDFQEYSGQKVYSIGGLSRRDGYGRLAPPGGYGRLASHSGYGWLLPHSAISGPVPGLARPVVTPVMVQGISGRALSRLEKVLGRSIPSSVAKLQFVESGGSKGTSEAGLPGKAPALVPGSAVGIQLMRGDASVTAIGTVTYIRGNEFLAFGHPFLAKGEVGLYATSAYIHHVVTGLSMPFKIGSPGALVGAVSQDRLNGVLGKFGMEPRGIPVSVSVRDRDTGIARTFKAQVVDDQDISSELITAFVLQAFDTTLDRIGSGTCKLEVALNVDGLNEPVRRENMYFSDLDISATSLDEIHELVDTIHRNEFRDVAFKSINIASEVQKGQRRAIIREARAKENHVHPGDTVHIEVSFQPYRAPAQVKSIEVKIPEDISPGTLYLTVRGGNALLPQGSNNEGDQPPAPRETHKDLDELIQSLVSREKNSDIVVEYYPPSAEGGEPDVQPGTPGTPGTPPDAPDGAVPVARAAGYRPAAASYGPAAASRGHAAAIYGPAAVSYSHAAAREESQQRPAHGRQADEGTLEGLKKHTFPSEYVMDGSCEVEVTVEAS